MTDPVQISRDPFARQTLMRRVSDNKCKCDWCGGTRTVGHRTLGRKVLFAWEYGTANDASHRIDWHRGAFCSKSCHDSYHS